MAAALCNIASHQALSIQSDLTRLELEHPNSSAFVVLQEQIEASLSSFTTTVEGCEATSKREVDPAKREEALRRINTLRAEEKEMQSKLKTLKESHPLGRTGSNSDTVAAALPSPNTVDNDQLLDPLSAFAASTSATISSTEAVSRPGTSRSAKNLASGIDASAGRHYFDLKALQADLQATHNSSGSGFSRVTGSVSGDWGDDESHDDDYDDGHEVEDADGDGDVDDGRKPPRIQKVASTRGDRTPTTEGGRSHRSQRSRSGAATPRSSLSAVQAASPALQSLFSPQPHTTSRIQRELEYRADTGSRSRNSSRPSSRMGGPPPPASSEPSLQPPERLDPAWVSSRLRRRSSPTEGESSEVDEGEGSGSVSQEVEFLSRLHLMSEDDLQHVMGATIRPRRSPRLLSNSSRPSATPLQTESTQHSISSPALASEATSSTFPKHLREAEGTQLCRKLSKALADALSEAAAAIRALQEQGERHERELDIMKRRHQTRFDAALAVCSQHGITAGVIDRAVARALADMPQVCINVEEEARAQKLLPFAPGTPEHSTFRRASMHLRSVEAVREKMSRCPAGKVSTQSDLHSSLQEAMLDGIHISSSQASPVLSFHRGDLTPDESKPSSEPPIRRARCDADVGRSDLNYGDGFIPTIPALTSRRSPSAVSVLSCRSSTADCSSTTARLSRSKAVEGLLPWSSTSKDRKASATTQTTDASTVEAEGYISETSERNNEVLLSKPSNPPVALSSRPSPSASGFLSSFRWRRSKTTVMSIPATASSTPTSPHTVVSNTKATVASTPKPSSAAAEDMRRRTLSIGSASGLPLVDTSIHPQLDRTSSGRDVISALHDAIGNGPVSPSSEHPAHQIDLKALPKPPSLKAIFLATRILGNDASSLLQNRGRQVSPKVAEKAVDIVKKALEQGLAVDELPHRTQSQQRTSRRVPPSPVEAQRDVHQRTPFAAQLSPAKADQRRERPHSTAVQAAAAIVEAASASSAATAGRATGQGHKTRSPYQTRIEPNVTRLPRYFGYGGSALPSAIKQSRAKARQSSDPTGGKDSELGLPVELEAIVPLDGKPPTLALFSQDSNVPARHSSRQTNDNDSSGDEFEVYGGKGDLIVPQPIRSSAIAFDDRAVDVFGFVYDASPADVRLLRQARKASTPAPACLTGIRVGVEARGGPESEREEGDTDADTDADSITTHDEAEHAEAASEDIDAPIVTPPTPLRAVGKGKHSSDTSPVRLLGIAHSRPSTETSQLNALQAILDGGPTSPGQEIDFQLGGESAETTADTVATVTPLSKARIPRATSQTVRHLLDQLKVMHYEHQKIQKATWDEFIQHRRTAMSRTTDGSSTAVEREKERPTTRVARGLLADGHTSKVEDQYHHGLIGVRLLGDDKSSKEDRKRFLQLCQEGIPLAHRPKIWAECSGASDAAEPGLYADLLNAHQGETNSCLLQIDLDVHRTMPTNIYFGGDGPGVPKLRRVLAAYSWYNPSTGYCQGMNNLAATLLLTHATEEEAFWVLVCIIDKILPEDYYTSHLLVSQADQRVLVDFVKELMPALSAHLDDLGVDLPAVTFAWFLSLYTDCLPVETLFRVWDLLFVEGMTILFRVAVAILQMNEKKLLATTSPAAFYGHVHSMTSRLFSVDRLLQLACQDLRYVVTEEKVLRRRKIHVADIKQELGLLET